MITIDSPYIFSSTGTYSAVVAEIALEENNYAPLVNVGYGEAETSVIENPVGAEPLPADWGNVSAVAANGTILTPAIDPESPQEGEYLYNSYSNTVEIFVTGEVRSIVVYGMLRTIPFIPPLLSGPYPELFTNLPLQGQIQLGKSLENHPSGQLELELALPKSQIQEIFAPGSELELYGTAYRINPGVRITELPTSVHPGGVCRVSISLGGKWENYTEQSIFLRTDGKNDTPNDTPFQDGDCTNPTGVKSEVFNTSATVPALLQKAGIPYFGPSLAPVPITRSTRRDATVVPAQLLNSDRLRTVNSFVRWSDAKGVVVVPIDSLKVWEYRESDILGEVETSFEAIAKTSKRPMVIPNLNQLPPNLTSFPSTVQSPPVPTLRNEPPIPLGFEYPNIELTGELFTETKRDKVERLQGKSQPRYVRKEPKKTTRVDGDKDAHIPLDSVFSIQFVSLCFDCGGQTKTRSTPYEEDGTPIYTIDEIWGFVFYADEIYNAATGKLAGDPNQYWQCLKYTRTDYIYDLSTGYKIGSYTSGYNTVRDRSETPDKPETLSLDPSDPEYDLYKFRRIPVNTKNSLQLRLTPDYSTEGLFEIIKICNRDGTSSLQALINPDFAPPYYVERERTESVAFASRFNPENEGLTIAPGTKLAPDLIVGEESRFESSTQVEEAIYEEKLVRYDGGTPYYKVDKNKVISPQKNITFIKQFKAQGTQIAEALEETSIEESTGDLSQAQRRSPLYELEQKIDENLAEFEPRYRYFLQTEGYSIADPVTGSESFNVATTLDEALTGARCKLAIENWRNGFSETLQIPVNLSISEGDRFNYWCKGEYRQRVVLSVSTTINILGAIGGVPRVTAVTSLTLGRYTTPQLNYVKVPYPRLDITVAGVVNQTLGGILDWSRVRSRRNPEGEES